MSHISPLLEIYKKDPVPPPIEIAKQVAESELMGLSPDDIKNGFDKLIEKLLSNTHRRYLEIESQKGVKAIKNFLLTLKEKNNIRDVDRLIAATSDNFMAFDDFFLSLIQSRKSRAGTSFEYFINIMFEKLNYPYIKKPLINGTPDFLFPSIDHFKKNPSDCIIFTVKRTLKERWRQIITEGARGPHFFLATIDENISENQLKEMSRNRINVVVPSSIKESRYGMIINVMNFKNFFELHLEPAMERWRRTKI